jgi:hypothetical protein
MVPARHSIYRHVGCLAKEMQLDKMASIKTIFVHEGQWATGDLALGTVGGQALRQTPRQSTHGRRTVGRVQENIEHVWLTLVGKGFGKGLDKRAVTGNLDSLAPAHQLAHALIPPFMDIVEGPFENLPFGRIPNDYSI